MILRVKQNDLKAGLWNAIWLSALGIYLPFILVGILAYVAGR